MDITRYAPWKGVMLSLAPLVPASYLFGPVLGQAAAFAAAATAMVWAAHRRV